MSEADDSGDETKELAVDKALKEKTAYQGLTPDLDISDGDAAAEEEKDDDKDRIEDVENKTVEVEGKGEGEVEDEDEAVEAEGSLIHPEISPSVFAEPPSIDAWKLRLGVAGVMIVALLTVAYAVQTYKSVKDDDLRPIPKMIAGHEREYDADDSEIDEFKLAPSPEKDSDWQLGPEASAVKTNSSGTSEQEPAAASDETIDEQSAAMREIEQVEADVNDLNVPEQGPQLNIEAPAAEVEPPTQPIVWENEQQKIKRVVEDAKDKAPEAVTAAEEPKSKQSKGAEEAKQKDLKPSEQKPQEAASSEDENLEEKKDQPSRGRSIGLMTPKEILVKVVKKEELRQQIADIDMKLESLNIDSEEKARDAQRSLENKLKSSEQAAAVVKIKLRKTKSLIRKWDYLRAQSGDDQIFELAKAVAKLNTATADKLSHYFETNKKYSSAFQKWQEDPTKIELASEMGAIARQLESMEAGLAQTIDDTIARELENTRRQRAEYKLTLKRLAARKMQINRHIGYLKGYTPLQQDRKIELRDLYVEKRERALKELNSLRAIISDEKEKEFSQKHLK